MQGSSAGIFCPKILQVMKETSKHLSGPGPLERRSASGAVMVSLSDWPQLPARIPNPELSSPCASAWVPGPGPGPPRPHGPCHACARPLQPVGFARKNGKAHADWPTRRYHKKCWKNTYQSSAGTQH